MPFDAPPQESAYYAPAQTAGVVVLPAHLQVGCFKDAARDYVLNPMVLVAIVKVESNGKAVSTLNTNGTVDHGIAQINTASWGRHVQERYGISTQALLTSNCQSVRVMAYALRSEMNSRECAGVDVWCGVGRYHSPGNPSLRATYVPKVQQAMNEILRTGKF